MVTIAILDPLQPPRLAKVESSKIFETCQKLVGGYVEIPRLTEEDSRGFALSAYVNENGIAEGCPLNRKICGFDLFGTIVAVRERIDDEGETHHTDLTEDDLRLLRSAGYYGRTPSGIEIVIVAG